MVTQVHKAKGNKRQGLKYADGTKGGASIFTAFSVFIRPTVWLCSATLYVETCLIVEGDWASIGSANTWSAKDFEHYDREARFE